MRVPLAAVLLVSGLPSQAPQLAAAEVAGVRALMSWHASRHTPTKVHDLGRLMGGYQAKVIVDVDGETTAVTDSTRAGRTYAYVLWPYSDELSRLTGRRLLFSTPSGRILLGRQPAALTRGWQPTVETIASPGVRAHVNNMLGRSGTAQDGTQWESIEVDVAPGDGIAATGLCLSVLVDGRHSMLSAGDLRTEANVLRASVRPDSWRERGPLDDQAEAVLALRLAVRYQRALLEAGTLDRDHDGRGEYGLALELLPQQRRADAETAGDRRLFYENHLFEAFLPGRDGRPVSSLTGEAAAVDADGAERHFAILAWPAQAGQPGARVFFVDERGEVLWADAGDLGGHDRAPAFDCAFAEGAGSFGAPLSFGRPGRDGRVWHPLQAR